MVTHGQQCLVHSRIRARETGRSSPAQRGVGLERVSWICGARWSGFFFHIERVSPSGDGMLTLFERRKG